MEHHRKFSETGPCHDRPKCIKVLHLIIDGEAGEEDEVYFYEHINQCMDCSMYYKLEQTIRNALRKKMKKKVVPEDFILQLKAKVRESINS